MKIKRELLDKIVEHANATISRHTGWSGIGKETWGEISKKYFEERLKQAGVEIEEEMAYIKQDWFHIYTKYENGKTIFYVNNEKVNSLDCFFNKEFKESRFDILLEKAEHESTAGYEQAGIGNWVESQNHYFKSVNYFREAIKQLKED